jgi:hypothetical protein
MNNYTSELDMNISDEMIDRITFGQLWGNQPPVMQLCLGLTCLSFSMVYMLLFTML